MGDSLCENESLNHRNSEWPDQSAHISYTVFIYPVPASLAHSDDPEVAGSIPTFFRGDNHEYIPI